MKCPSCGKEIKENVNYCNQCGTKKPLEVSQFQCQDCSTMNELDAKRCENCGSENLAPEPTPDDFEVLF